MLGGLAKIRQQPFFSLFTGLRARSLQRVGLRIIRKFRFDVFIMIGFGARGAFSRFKSDIAASLTAESVRRVTLIAKLIDCACKRGLLDFVLAHGEPVLCRYAPNPR
jgi:hypothetical protein